MQDSPTASGNASVVLEESDCEADFRRYENMEAEYDRRFEGHPMLEVFYEDLASEYQAEMKRVFPFLGLPVKDVVPIMYKQAKLPLPLAVENYRQLKTHFSDSKWREYFDE